MSELALKVEVDPRGKKLYDDIAKRFPREMARAVARTGSIMKRQLVAALRSSGGKSGVPKWSDLHPVSEFTRLGMRMSEMTKQIVLKRYGRGTIEIGWVEGLQELAGEFHSADTYAYTNIQKARIIGGMRRKGIEDGPRLGDQYKRPARPLYEPYTRNLPPEKIRQWMLGNIRKMIEKTAAKSRG